MAIIMPMGLKYGAIKATLNAYASQLAHRLAKDGVRSHIVSPGPIYFECGFWDQVKQRNPELYKRASQLSAFTKAWHCGGSSQCSCLPGISSSLLHDRGTLKTGRLRANTNQLIS
jgi:short-subunit dehydrogenase